MYMFLTDDQLGKIASRVEATQQGPWKSFVEGRDHTSGSSFIMTGEGLDNWSGFELVGATIADQDFIAAARQDVPLLLKEIKMLKEMLANKG